MSRDERVGRHACEEAVSVISDVFLLPRPRNPQLRHSSVKRRGGAVDSTNAPPAAFQHRRHVPTSHVDEAGAWDRGWHGRDAGNVRHQRATRGEAHRAFNHVAQLADVSGPGVSLQVGQTAARNRRDPLAEHAGRLLDECPGEGGNVFYTLA